MDNDSSTFYEEDLTNFLKNRKQLDFALKLALGSQTNLHQISIRQEDSASISSLEHMLSPFKSQSKYNNKKSRFASKQNLNHLDTKILQKAESIKPQIRMLKQKWHKVVSWINFVSKHFKLSAISGENLNISQLNTFFKDIVYKLQKMQQLETQQYNTKFILCQLTQMTIKKQMDADKILNLQIEIVKKQKVIQQLQDVISSLKGQKGFFNLEEEKNKEIFLSQLKKNDKESSQKLYSKIGTQSLVFSISQQGSQIAQSRLNLNPYKQSRNQKTTDKSMISPYYNQQNQNDQMLLISSTEFNKKISLKDINSNSQYSNNNDLDSVKTNLQNKFQAIQQAHEELKNNEQKSLEDDYCNDSINKSKIQNSRGILQNSLSKETIRMQQLLQIKEQMVKILQQNDFLRQKIKTLKKEFQSSCIKQNSVMNSTKENLHYDNSVSVSINQLKMEHESVIKQKEFLNQYNQNLKQYVQQMNLKVKDQELLIMQISKQKNQLEKRIKQLLDNCSHLQTANINIEEEVKFLRERLIQINRSSTVLQMEDVSIQKDVTIIQKKFEQQINESNLLDTNTAFNNNNEAVKLGITQQINKNHQKQINILTQKYQKLKNAIFSYKELYQKLKRKYLKKASQLKEIKSIIKQAKKINQSDMKKLEQTILGRKILKEKQISQLKAMEEAWKATIKKEKYEKTQFQASKLQLANNRFRLIASMKSKGKRLSKSKRSSIKKQMQKIVQQKKSQDMITQKNSFKKENQNSKIQSQPSEDSLLLSSNI